MYLAFQFVRDKLDISTIVGKDNRGVHGMGCPGVGEEPTIFEVPPREELA